ncbi:Aste57867_15973 [Aphanomyces stellatus]|uniref:Aste57867_15973 protein n=1 Tax=Aphanomyces stellatus TaxID=120398 RepID=A0A485L4F0_9STRA|nr:hypothetical protein As57867_015917 [Aphanomyces stellatus]VFT92758.1 Aste57867_15973 [Aphanomyces stellatus]
MESTPPKQEVTETQAEVDLSFPAVRFRSHPDVFRVRVRGATVLPITISLESKRTKGQWECVVSDLKEHAFKDAHVHTDASEVVSALQQAFIALEDEDSTWTNSKVDINYTRSGSMLLMLVFTPPSSSSMALGLTFDMMPFAMSTTDILELKMRDLMKDIERLQKAPEPVLMLVSDGRSKPLGDHLYSTWTVHPSLEPRHFALSEDGTEIVFLKKGGYHIQVRGLSGAASSTAALGAGSSLIPSTFELFIDHVHVSTSQGYGNFCQLSHVFSVEKTTAVSVSIRGYHAYQANVMVLVEQFMKNAFVPVDARLVCAVAAIAASILWQVITLISKGRFTTEIHTAIGIRPKMLRWTHLCRGRRPAPTVLRLFSKAALRTEEHFFSLLVVNRPGTLAQITSAFAALGTNVGSLAVQTTLVPELSRMIITATATEQTASKILRRLRRMVCVTFLHSTTMHHCLRDEAFVLQSQLLLRLHIPPEKKTPIDLLLNKYNGIIVDENEPPLLSPDDEDAPPPLPSTIVHVVNAPHLLNTFLHRLTLDGVTVLECQSASPCFLDIFTQSTLQPKPLQATATTKRTTYSKARRNLHDRIAAQLFFPAHVPAQLRRPKFILLLGIPGSGKTSILSELDQTERIVLNDFVNFDVDDVIALLPEFYTAMLNIGLGNMQDESPADPHTRYNQCQDEAKFILDQNLKLATMDRRNVILHGSGRSLDKYQDIIQSLDRRYEVHVMCVDIPLDVAMERVENRSKGYGRNVPKEFVEEAERRIRETFPTLAKELPYAHVFDSSTWPPALVWSKQSDRVIVDEPTHPVQVKYGL